MQTQPNRITKVGEKCTIIENRTLAMLKLKKQSRGVAQ